MSSQKIQQKFITKLTNFTVKRIPLYLFLVVLPVVALVSMGVYSAVSSATTRTVTTIGGEIFVVTEELTTTPQGIGITTTTTGAVGNTLATAVTMTGSGASANTALTQGKFEYRVRVEIASVSDDQKYSVELYADGTSLGTVYIKQAETGASTNDYVTIKWDLDTSLDDSVYEILIVEE